MDVDVKPAASEPKDDVVVLDVLGVQEAERPTPLIVGNVSLAEFRLVLDNQGFITRFDRGVLIVNDKIGVHKVRRALSSGLRYS